MRIKRTERANTLLFVSSSPGVQISNINVFDYNIHGLDEFIVGTCILSDVDERHQQQSTENTDTINEASRRLT